MALTTIADYRAWNTAAANIADAVVTAALTSSQVEMERYCGRKFESASRTENFYGNDSPTIVLKHAPVTTLTSVSTVDTAGTATALSSTGYRVIDAEAGVLERLGSDWGYDSRGCLSNLAGTSPTRPWWRKGQHYRVVYTGGFLSPTYDDELADLEACLWQIMDLKLFERGMGPVQSVSFVTFQATLAAGDERAKRLAEILGRYRRWSGS